jgi:hypothetical protein
MRTVLWFILGFGLAFAAGLAAVASGGLAGVGVAAHFLLQREPGMGDVLNFDPSEMLGRSPAPAAVAVGFVVAWFLVARRLKRRPRMSSRAD